jgi:hypothetical protein
MHNREMVSFSIHFIHHENAGLISCTFGTKHLHPNLSVNVILSGTENKYLKDFDADTWRKYSHAKPSRRWEDYIKIGLKELVLGGADLIYVADDSDKWWSALGKRMNISVP